MFSTWKQNAEKIQQIQIVVEQLVWKSAVVCAARICLQVRPVSRRGGGSMIQWFFSKEAQKTQFLSDKSESKSTTSINNYI
jgi:hypothetical protein